MKKSFDTLDEAYKELVVPLTQFAKKHLANKDLAIDAVHDAFGKALEHVAKHPEARIRRYLMYRETIRACRRMNQKNHQLVSPLPADSDVNGRRNAPKISSDDGSAVHE